MTLKCFEIDPGLPQHVIWNRVNGFKHWKGVFEKNESGIEKFAEGYKIFGMNRNEADTGFVFREYLPGAKQVFLIGEFNNWENKTPLKNEGFGRWMVELPDKAPGDYMVPHKTKYKIRLESHDGSWHDRVPAWAKVAWQDGNKLFDAAMWEPPAEERYTFKHPNPPKPVGLKIYEAHVGMSSPECKINTYLDFADNVLPRIHRLGYNAIQLMAVAEHAYYGCFGYHVTSFFAPSSRFGTPEELKYLVDRAHGMGIQVLVDLVHAHCSSNAADGIAMLDGTDHCYTHGGLRGYHSQWDSRLFNYENYETLRFLLSNVKYWLSEFRFDGFRFDGVSSMLYHSHAIGKTCHDYFGGDADVAAHIYLMLSNDVIKSILPSATTIAEDVSGMPTIALPIEWGGFGFDARLAMAIPDMWIKILKESPCDEAWSMKWIAGELQNRRKSERSIAYAESHDQAIVGDKTIAFWLMDAEMYTGMSTLSPASPCIERGLALHKMIRMVCLALGEGYLNFCGNEFGHPEWVDFPREGNGWSYHHANRRYDLPDQDHLRYKFFNEFDMLMQQVENRFKFLSDWHYHCTLISEEDKVIAVERGECLVVFNFHPTGSYADYRIGCKWNEPMRTVLDSDEGRFGGHCRLEWGHANSFPAGDGWMGRNHSIKVYLPSRTVQVFVPERHLQGGIRLAVDPSFIGNTPGIASASDLTVVLLEEKVVDGQKQATELTKHSFGADGVLRLPEHHEVAFVLRGPSGAQVKCASEFDGHFHVYFPGVYLIAGIGCIHALGPYEIEAFEKEAEEPTKAAAKAVATPGIAAAAEGTKAFTPPPRAKAAAAQEAEEEHAAKKVAEEAAAAQKAEEERAAKKAADEAAAAQKAEEERAAKKAAEEAAAAQKAEEERAAKEKAAEKARLAEEERLSKERAEAEAAAAQAAAAKQAEEEPVKEPPAPPAATAAPPAVEPEEDATGEMARWPSMHLWGPADSMERQVSSEAPAPAEGKAGVVGMDGFGDLLASLQEGSCPVSQGYKAFGLHQEGNTWTFREWLPQVQSAFLVGDFNSWDTSATPLSRDAAQEDVWTCTVKAPQAAALLRGQKYKVYATSSDGRGSYLTPAWATRMTFTQDLHIFDAVVWPLGPPASAPPAPAPQANERIYECHLGLAARQGQPKSFAEAAEVLIPRAARNGYTALLLLGVQESKSYANMGAQPCVYNAPTSCLGEPEDLQAFVAKAHGAGLRVYMSVAHDGAAWCGDGLGDQFFKGGTEPADPITGARLFDFAKQEVLHYLLSSLCFWMAQYGFDGFHFPRVSSMIYTTRGRWLPQDLEELEEYVKKPGMVDEAAVQYLRLANSIVHEQGRLLGKQATTIADESSLFPGLCVPVEGGGLGFDLRQSSAASQLFRQLLKRRDEDWVMSELLETVVRPRGARVGEAVVAGVEAAKDCVVSQRPLKIAMLAWETLHTIAVGGVAPHVTELAAALHGAGHEVHIFTRAQGAAMDHAILGVHYHEVTYGSHSCMVQDIRNMCGAFVHALNCHEGVWGAFDLVHGHDWLAGPAIQQLKGQGKKCVFTMHSTEGGRNGDMGKGHPGIKDIERCACGAADKLIAVSGVLKEECQCACGADGGKMSVIYNGIHAGPIVNMEWHDDWTGNTKRDKGWNPMDPMFLFVGRHTAQKGCDILIRAIPMILQARGDAKFVIVGDGHLKASNEGIAYQSGIGHAVCFTGSLKSGSAHLKALFRACDAVVVPSRNEPFGIVVLEAWASGKPVVATTSGGPRDFVKPGEDGYLVDPNPGSVAWGCCKIMENFEHSKWMGLNAQAKAMREFSWEHIAHDTEQVYYSLLNLQGAPRSADREAGYSLAHTLLREKCFSMEAGNGDPLVHRGLSILKLLKLLTASLGGDAVMTWMGSEFAQIDVTDMPRPANGFNDESSRVKYELADNTGLKFSQMEAFEAALNRIASEFGWLACPKHTVLAQSEEDKVIAYARAGCVFVFNFHPSVEHAEYSLTLPPNLKEVSPLRCVLDTNDQKFGGQAATATTPVWEAKTGVVRAKLPPRSALVLAATDPLGLPHVGA